MKLFARKMQPKARIDLETVRETLAYMHDDMQRAPELAAIASALERAIAEIDTVSRPDTDDTDGAMQNVVALPALRLVPWKPGT